MPSLLKKLPPSVSEGKTTKRLLFFHHAGGSANQYLNLLRPWRDDFEIYVLDLPGRAFRLEETAVVNYGELLNFLSDELQALVPRKTWLFGHSMGALIAASLVNKLEEAKSSVDIVQLGLSAFRPPTKFHISCRSISSSMSEKEFAQALEKIEPLPAIAKQIPQAYQLLLQAAREDFQLLEGYDKHPLTQPLRVKTMVFGGETDPEVPAASLQQWQEFLAQPVSVKIYPGGHFYIFQHFHQIISEFLKH